jgi:hypothetical protein
VLLARISADITSPRHLNPPRRNRTYPRAVKRTRRNAYPARKPGDHGKRHDTPATIRLPNLVKPQTAA